MERNDELQVMIEVIKRASKRVLEIYNNKEFSIDEKEDNSPVTIADLESERIILDGLEKFGYGSISEERGVENLENEFLWVIDPIDGTKDFIQKRGDFSIMIGLMRNFVPVLGVVCIPARNQIFYGCRDSGSFLIENGTTRRVYCQKEDNEIITMLVSRNHFTEKEKTISERIGIDKYIEMGSIGTKMVNLSIGTGNLYLNLSKRLRIWDIVAPYIILKEAGGDIFDSCGKEIDFRSALLGFEIIATNGVDRNRVLNAIRESN